VTAQLPRNREFRRLWLGDTASSFGYQMLVLAVGWQMYELTDSALSLGLIGLVQFGSQLLFTLPAGHYADHHDRRRITAACQAMQCVVAATLAAGSAGAWLGSGTLYLCSFALGIAQAFQSPSVRALLPTIVTQAELPQAVAWSAAAKKAAVIIGPALGGVVYLAHAAAVYGAGAVFFALAGVLFARIHAPAQPPEPEAVSLKSVFGGFSFVRAHRILLGAISMDLFATLLGTVTALMPIYARDILETGPWGLGLLRAAPAVGAILVSAYLVRAPFRQGVGRTMFASVTVFGAATIAFGLSHSLPLSLAALAVMGAADMVSVVIRLSLVQLETPNDMRGRVSALHSLCTGTSNHLGQFRAGAMAQWLGTIPAVVVGGIGILLVVVLWRRWFPGLAQREALQSQSDARN